jgi:hypothetical protein
MDKQTLASARTYNESIRSRSGTLPKEAANMTEAGKQKAEAAAVTGVGAGVGTAGGATVGVLELAAQGTATALSAGVVIGAGAVAGAVTFFLGYKLFRRLTKPRT